MKLLVVAATESEISLFRKHLDTTGQTDVTILVTGVGMVNTTYELTKVLHKNKYDFLLQAGVGGSFDQQVPLGEVVFVTTDHFGDVGAEDHDQYLDIFELGLEDPNAPPYNSGRLAAPYNPLHDLLPEKKLHGITINTVSGNEHTIARRRAKYNCTVESMEGAAFHFVALKEGIPFAQVRAISNYVIPRDKSQWRMKDAIVNLNNWLIQFICTIFTNNQ